jgi:2-polyprenyl-6-methoxyphenol hydroxylase-like FAD-dependent oxidoreductase
MFELGCKALAAKRVVIIGGGIAGLASALALKGSGHEVVIIERDPEPPSIAPEAAFETWQRPGVPQFRHAHILLARIQTTLRDRHPELLAELLDAGLYLSTVEEILPPSDYTGIQPMAGDGDLLHLWGRRATFEYVVRRHVGRLSHVQFVHSARVEGLVTELAEHEVRVRGVEFTRADSREVISADLVVDASGRRTRAAEWLAAHGVKTETESKPSGFVYACRHYRLKEPHTAPPRQQGGGNFDYLGYATFYAEHGNFALTFGCPEEETELAAAIRRPEGFDALCAQLPVLRHWTSQSDVTTKVLGAGRFENRWTRFGIDENRPLLGFLAVGDSQVETNPMYGRGCASAFVQADVLAEALRIKEDPTERARFYYERSRLLLQPYFDLSVATDKMYRTRANLRRGQSIPFPERVINYAYENAWLPATRTSPLMAREFLRSVQMREIASPPSVKLAVLFHLLRAWIGSWFGRRSLPAMGPSRAEFLQRLEANLRAPSESPSLRVTE